MPSYCFIKSPYPLPTHRHTHTHSQFLWYMFRNANMYFSLDYSNVYALPRTYKCSSLLIFYFMHNCVCLLQSYISTLSYITKSLQSLVTIVTQTPTNPSYLFFLIPAILCKLFITSKIITKFVLSVSELDSITTSPTPHDYFVVVSNTKWPPTYSYI